LILLASFQQLPNLVYAAGVRKSASCSSVKGRACFLEAKRLAIRASLRPLFRGLHREMSAFAGFRHNAASRLNKLWRCCNTLTILKESLAAERIAWFATQRIRRIGGLP
jgi:hypothetical protein